MTGSPVELSYLADNVILLRYFEAFGQVRQAISAVKKRTGSHERSVRELRISDNGLRVGRELREFQGVLGGSLSYLGEAQPLLGDELEIVASDAGIECLLAAGPVRIVFRAFLARREILRGCDRDCRKHQHDRKQHWS